MTTLIAVYNSSGLVGRCDAKCYDAEGPDCQCICGGRNHGAGLQRATDNTREWCEQWLEQYAREKQLTAYHAEIPALEPVQLALF